MPRSPLPVVADIHFQYKLALAALDAGVHQLRLNPGNIRKPEHIKLVASEARDRGISIRIGVNAGSLDPELYEQYGGPTAEAMVESAKKEIGYFEDVGYDLIEISVKSSNVAVMIEAYRQLADVTDHPSPPRRHRSRPDAAGHREGHRRHRHAARRGHRRHDPLLAHRRSGRGGEGRAACCSSRWACASAAASTSSRARRCGRAEIDVIAVAEAAQAALEGMNLPIQVAVMGCVVNGPGEARSADIGIAAGRQRGHLFIKGEVVRVVPEAAMVDELVRLAEVYVKEGPEAAPRAGRPERGRGGRGRPRRAARRPGRRRQRERAARRADPQARHVVNRHEVQPGRRPLP